MTSSNPMTGGFRAILRVPAILVLEIIWRWCFGITAFLLLLFPGLMLLGSIKISDADLHAFQSRDAMLISLAVGRFAAQSGKKLVAVAAVVFPAITVIWMIFSAAGRTFTLRRLFGNSRTIRFRHVLALHFWRAAFLWITIAVAFGAVLFAAWFASRGPRPDYVTYYIVVAFLTTAAGIFWSIVNWHLSLAALWLGTEGTGAYMALRMSMGFASAHRGEVAGLSLLFTLVRVLAVALAFVLCVAPVSMAASLPNVYLVWTVVVSLAYLAFADFLYVSRLASYVLLEEFDSSEPGPILNGKAPSVPGADEHPGLPSGSSMNGH